MIGLPRIKPSGPSPSPIMLVGEAPGESEVILNKPFAGASGQELTKMLAEAGIDRNVCYITNVFLSQPPRNNSDFFFVSTKEATPESKSLGAVGKGKYINQLYIDEVYRLRDEILVVKPQIIVALGSVAMWALLGKTGIGTYRGVAESWTSPDPSYNPIILPTFHPTAVLRNWQLRAIAIADLKKAARHLDKDYSDSVSNETLSIKINPILQEIHDFVPLAYSAPFQSIDVETKANQIRTISFTISPGSAFVIPFWDSGVGNYWKTLDEEVEAISCIRTILSSPCPKIFQNGAYDIQYIWKTWGVPVLGPLEDTMLLHHALQPELQKGLGFLGSIYLDRPAWKVWRKEHAEKKDD